MKPIWIIEKDLWEREEELLFQLKWLGRDFKLVSSDPMGDITPDPEMGIPWIEIGLENWPQLIPYGSIRMMERWSARKRSSCFDLPPLSWEKYAPHWGQYLLNDDYYILPYGEVLRRSFEGLTKGLASASRIPGFGNAHEAVFIRPVSNNKIFSGRLFYRDTFAEEIRKMGYSFEVDLPAEMLVCIASQKKIVKEWRFFIFDGKVSCPTQYGPALLSDYLKGCSSPKAMDLAIKVAYDPFQPLPSYTLDIAELDDGRVKVVEIGAVNSSGFYGADIVEFIEGMEVAHGCKS